MNFKIAVFAGAVVLAILGITLSTLPQTASAPGEAQPIEHSSTHALEFRSQLPPISPPAEATDNVYHYY